MLHLILVNLDTWIIELSWIPYLKSYFLDKKTEDQILGIGIRGIMWWGAHSFDKEKYPSELDKNVNVT